MEDMIRAIAALLVVLAAILGLGYALRRFSAGRINAEGRASDRRVLEWRGLDARRKLVVVRWDDREHLLCLSPAGDCVVSSRNAPEFKIVPDQTDDEGGSL